MNTRTMQSNLLINLDWVAFSVLLIPSPLEKDAHKFTLCDISEFGFRMVEYAGTNIYSRRVIIFDDTGQKLLTLLFQPHSRIIDYRSCLIEVANPLLYHKSVEVRGWTYGGLLWVPELLMLVHAYQFQCLSRIDIAADFELTPDRADFVKGLSNDNIYLQRYRDGVSFHQFECVQGSKVARVTKQLSWGSKHSNIKWKTYNKSLEVFEYVKEGDKVVRHCNKPYIVDRWAAEGWNVENVWRLEVSICPLEKYRLRGKRLTFDNLSNAFIIDDLFATLYSTKFVTRLNEGHDDRSNDKRVWFLGDMGEWEKLGLREPTEEKIVVAYINGLRSAMQQIETEEVKVNETMLKLWIDTATRCVEIGGLQSYFLNTYGYAITTLPARALHHQTPPQSNNR